MIYSICHKEYDFPDGYKPLTVAGYKLSNNKDYVTDNLGDNISSVNEYWSELTGAYWLWKNITDKQIGMVHYRRYFTSEHSDLVFKEHKIATTTELFDYLLTHDIVAPTPRNYFVVSIKTHYIQSHHEEDYYKLRHELELRYPEYLSTFDSVMDGTEISLYNMMVCNKEIFDAYNYWLFDVLCGLEEKIKYKEYDKYQKRVFGFMAERLFNVWIKHNKLNVKYIDVINTEGEDYIVKGINFIGKMFSANKGSSF